MLSKVSYFILAAPTSDSTVVTSKIFPFLRKKGFNEAFSK